MTILTEFGNLHISLKWKDILPKKLSSSFCHALAYLPKEYERNRIFDPCREIKNFWFLQAGTLNTSENLDFPYDAYDRFNLDDMDEAECIAELGFEKRLILRLEEVLQIPL